WGKNEYGGLGDGSRRRRGTPVEVRGLPPAVEVAVGWIHTCARTESKEVYCWGSDYFDQLPDHQGDSLEPVKVQGLSDVVDLDANASSTCAVTGAGAVHCWGKNDQGQ